ncbi:hypothetical protein BH20VER3_BH20VER3_05450 [soil metagenome]
MEESGKQADRHGLFERFFQQSSLLLRKEWLHLSLLALFGLLVHAPALSGQLVWDDDYLARDNPFIKSPLLILEAFRHHLFLDSFSGHYRPVQNISFMVDYFFWNSNTFGYHLTNVLLHIGSGILLYFLLRRLLRSLLGSNSGNEAVSLPILAFVTALLWVVHPVHSAAVDYISGRADSLAFLMACAAWLLHLRARGATGRAARISLHALAACAGLLALCSRETALIWLVIFILHALFLEKKQNLRSKGVLLLFCLGLMGAYLFLRQLPQDRPSLGPSHGWDGTTRSVLMLRALGDYGRLLVFPSNLHMERTIVNPDNYRTAQSWRDSAASEYLSVLGLIVLGVFIAGSFRKGVGQRVRILGAGWFLVSYLPLSNLVELNATVAEHWLYLPSVGFLIFLAGCALDSPLRYRKAAVAGATLALVGLSVRSALRSADWVSEETFYKQTIAAGGMSTRVGVNLAQVYATRGEYAKAEELYRRVLAMAPDYPIARNNLADVLYRQGKKTEAMTLFASANTSAEETRKEYPRTWIAALNLAHFQHGAGHDSEALATLAKARADYPGTWELVSLEAELLRLTKGPAAALPLVENFARDHWWHYGAALALGRLYAEKGDVERAAETLRGASRLDVHEVDALNLIARIRLNQHRLAEAYRAQKMAVSRRPDGPIQHIFLSDILEKMGQPAAAKAAFAEGTRLKTVGHPLAVLAN